MSSLRERLEQGIQRRWYQADKSPSLFFLPLSWCYAGVAARRRKKFLNQPHVDLSVPIVVVGNISVGGTGKSPLVAALVKLLHEHEYRPAILSRGYGGGGLTYPHLVKENDSPAQVGDEALMLQQMLSCPVMVDPDRVRGAKALIQKENPDIILCDDGLQHYALPRDLEIVVLDGTRGLGNGQLLPAGPLREPASRLSEVDLVLCNGSADHLEEVIRQKVAAEFLLRPSAWRHMKSGERVDIANCPFGQLVHGVAGIGNPGRFFMTLEGLGLTVEGHSKPDHFDYHRQDLPTDSKPVVMTAKDGVKCRNFAEDHWWVLEVEAELPTNLQSEFLKRCEQLICRSAE